MHPRWIEDFIDDSFRSLLPTGHTISASDERYEIKTFFMSFEILKWKMFSALKFTKEYISGK